MENNKIANRVSVQTIIANLILSVFKLIIGFIGNSSAMISDAIHSASDVFSTIVVMIGIKMAAKESDKEHPYGHEKWNVWQPLYWQLCCLSQVLESEWRHFERFSPGIMRI